MWEGGGSSIQLSQLPLRGTHCTRERLELMPDGAAMAAIWVDQQKASMLACHFQLLTFLNAARSSSAIPVPSNSLTLSAQTSLD